MSEERPAPDPDTVRETLRERDERVETERPDGEERQEDSAGGDEEESRGG